MSTRYSIGICEKPFLLPQYSLGLYRESLIENHTNNDLIIISSDGSTHFIPKLRRDYHTPESFKISEKISKGKDYFPSNTPNGIEVAGKSTVCRVTTIDANEIRKSPVYIKELDYVVCTTAQHDSGVVEHPSSDRNIQGYSQSALQAVTENIKNPPLIVHANCTTEGSPDSLYLHLFGEYSRIEVSHENNLPNDVTFVVRNEYGEMITACQFTWDEILAADGKMTAPFGDVYFGASLEAVKNRVKKYQDYLASLRTPEELKAMSESAINKIKEDAALVETEKDRQYNILKNKYQDLEVKYEQIVKDLNLKKAIKDSDLDEQKLLLENEKINHERESSKMKVETTREKYETEQKLAEQKINREALATRKEETSFATQAVKTAAVAVPVIAGIATGIKLSTTSGLIGGLCRGIFSLAGIGAKTLSSIGSAICSTAKNVWSATKDFFSGALSWAF